jgi:hypothetical protein
MLMVITSFPCWSRTQQIRLNTLVKFEPAEPLFGGQFSTGANNHVLHPTTDDHEGFYVKPIQQTLQAITHLIMPFVCGPLTEAPPGLSRTLSEERPFFITILLHNTPPSD